MNSKLLTVASLFVLATVAQTASALPDELECKATVDLRAGTGQNDVIRVTNQGGYPTPRTAPAGAAIERLAAHFHVINARGQVQGSDVIKPLAENASVSVTPGQIFAGARLKYFPTPAGESQYFIQVVQHFALAAAPASYYPYLLLEAPLMFQATYRNKDNGQLVPLQFTCSYIPFE